eukprot:8276976-Ditylum_brightwellii.AAC.1
MENIDKEKEKDREDSCMDIKETIKTEGAAQEEENIKQCPYVEIASNNTPSMFRQKVKTKVNTEEVLDYINEICRNFITMAIENLAQIEMNKKGGLLKPV